MMQLIAQLLGDSSNPTLPLSRRLTLLKTLEVSQSRLFVDTYILYGHTCRTLFDDGVLLIGDAAGLAYPESGEGIRPAVESGLMAAQVIEGARADYRRANLRQYADRLTRRFGRRAPRTPTPGLLPARLKQRIAASLLATHWFSRHVLLDGWFLRARLPALQYP